MPNLRISGSQIHDTAIVMIITTTLTLVFLSLFRELGRSESNISLFVGFIISFFYWFTQYKIKK